MTRAQEPAELRPLPELRPAFARRNYRSSTTAHREPAQNMDLTGRRYGRVTVVSFTLVDPPGRRAWICKCDCGAMTVIRQYWLLSGKKTSCGCFRRKVLLDPNVYFWPKVSNRDQPDACWEWQGTRSNGYGSFMTKGRNERTHRHTMELTMGRRLTSREFVCHRCDNPPCCNPAHLFIGTPADNIHDMIRKGRQRLNPLLGESSPVAKLTTDIVLAIRREYRPGVSHQELADRYSVGTTTIGNILHRRTWRHVPEVEALAAKGGAA